MSQSVPWNTSFHMPLQLQHIPTLTILRGLLNLVVRSMWLTKVNVEIRILQLVSQLTLLRQFLLPFQCKQLWPEPRSGHSRYHITEVINLQQGLVHVGRPEKGVGVPPLELDVVGTLNHVLSKRPVLLVLHLANQLVDLKYLANKFPDFVLPPRIIAVLVFRHQTVPLPGNLVKEPRARVSQLWHLQGPLGPSSMVLQTTGLLIGQLLVRHSSPISLTL